MPQTVTAENAAIPVPVRTLEADQYVSFGSLSPSLPITLRERKVARYEASLLAYIGDDEQSQARLTLYRTLHEQLQTQRGGTQKVADELIAAAHPLMADFWTRLDDQGLGFLQRLALCRSTALLAEAGLQVAEGRLTQADHDRLKDIVSQPWSEHRVKHGTRTCDLSIGSPERAYLMLGILVITSQRALENVQHLEPVFLYVPGKAGGLHAFASVAQLKTQLGQSIRADQDGVWLNHVSVKSRAAAWQLISTLAAEEPLVLRELQGHAFKAGVEDQIASYQNAAQAATNGDPLFSGAMVSQAVEQLRLQMAENLMAPGNQAREQAIDRVAEQRRAALGAAQLPDWVIQAPVAIRAEYAKALKVYTRNAAWLEQDMERCLPSFEVFTRDKLADRLKADLKLEVDPDTVVVDMPDSVTVHVEQEAQGPERAFASDGEVVSLPITDFMTRDEVSLKRQTFSLSMLARLNIDAGDEQMLLRLKHARFSIGGLDAQAQGINLAYLIRAIPDLDIATQYSNRITEVFLGHTQASRIRDAGGIARRLGVYRQAINLEAWVARQKGHLTDKGLRLVSAATDGGGGTSVQNPEFDIEYRYALLRSPTRRDGSHTEQVLYGVSVLYDKTSQLSLMYLPGAPAGQCFFEDTSVQKLIARLANSVLLNNDLLQHLAHCTGSSSNSASNIQNINAVLRTGKESFIVIDPVKTPHRSLTDMQYLARMGLLKDAVNASSRSALDLEYRHRERAYEQSLKYTKMGLSVIPGIGTVIGVYDGWNDAVEAVQAFARGEFKQAALLGLSAGLNLADAIITLAPVMASPGALSKALGPLDVAVKQASAQLYALGNSASKALQKKRLHALLPSVSKSESYGVKAFEGYAVKVQLYDATPLSGQNNGVFKLKDRLYISHDAQVYEVFRRPGEKTLRLKARPPFKTYEAPIRQNAQGRWEYHAEVGGKGGSPITRLVDAPNLTRSEAVTHKMLLDYAVAPRILPADLPAIRPPGIESMDRVVIGHRDLFVSRALDEAGNYKIFRIHPDEPGKLQPQGQLTAEGIYRLHEQPVVPGGDIFEEVSEDFISMDRRFYRVQLDDEQYSWKVVNEGGASKSRVFVESDSLFDLGSQTAEIGKWRLTPQLNKQPGIEALTRQAFDLPATGFDYEMHRYLRHYVRQIIKTGDPRVMRASSVQELEELCSLHLSKHELPVARMDEVLTALANKQPLPVWAPVYDDLQGLPSILPLPSGVTFSAQTVRKMRSHLLIRHHNVEETALLADFAALRSTLFGQTDIHVKLGKQTEKIIACVMQNRGYTRLEGGIYRGGVHGFDLVLKGPNGDIYLLEVKQMQPVRGGAGSWGVLNLSSQGAGKHLQMSDEWVDAVLAESFKAWPGNEAAIAVRQAKDDGRLFKLLAAISPENSVMVFRVIVPSRV